MVQLTDSLVLELDDEAHSLKLSRSALIREILTNHLRQRAEASIGRRIAEGYRRVPPGQPDDWGDVAEVTDQATADVLSRLDAEEQAGGTPW